MLEQFKRFLVSLLYENGVASRTGLAALLLILLPMIILLALTVCMAVTEHDFPRYDSYIGAVEWLVTVGVGLLGYNKTITLKNGGTDK
ncbi:MAG TPA: hypothetical protein PKA28_10920 [Methylomusa anaerophila]|uniref:Uncharacterized protein n=1 Tax=Methylomusa anaerophila TaxID=1930071 RepID=A0A348AJ24_9FIRM|nr:hypothetical protein [Methylomusa anaerophila]BBB91072.1 hypothetical protein MAMMFC1_01740 [Methylomusa anaerophila]HML88947.1 hypothetical protein [Methylomusa anaerophila]